MVTDWMWCYESPHEAAEHIEKLEAFKAEALERLGRLSLALTRIECEAPEAWIRNIAREALYYSKE